MRDDTIPQTVLFPDLFDKPLVVAFDQAHASSDGGAILLKAADRALGLTAALAEVLGDPRSAPRVRQPWGDILAQRIFGIACRYADGNDADGLADDPIHKLLLDRDALDGRRLASQPTISLFENALRPRELYRLGGRLRLVLLKIGARVTRSVRRIVCHLPRAHPDPGSWRAIAASLGATAA